MKDRQHNDQRKKDKRTNNDLQNITQKTKKGFGEDRIITKIFEKYIFCTTLLQVKYY